MSLPAKPSSSRGADAIVACRVDPAAAAVELTDVSFAYDLRPILTGITMTIPRGKIVAIMGASGSGKTTILRLIGGQLRPKSGRVCVGGLSVPDLEPEALYALRRKFGMLFQFGALFTDMSVFENIAFPMREHTELPEELIRDLVLMKLQAVGLREILPGTRPGEGVKVGERVIVEGVQRVRGGDKAQPEPEEGTAKKNEK